MRQVSARGKSCNLNSFPDSVLNAPERPEYQIALEALRPVLYNLPPKVIAIDGYCEAGKTTLGRFLAWRFNISLLETDLFLVRNQGRFVYRNAHINAVIEARLKTGPIVVEGVVSLKLLGELDRTHDYHIHVKCDKIEEEMAEDGVWLEYIERYRAEETANLTLNLPAS